MSPFAEDNNSIRSIATNIIANEVENMKAKDVFKYSLKRSEKVKSLPTKTSVKLSSKDEATFVSYLLIQKLVVLASGCNISFNDCKGHEMRAYPPALFELTIFQSRKDTSNYSQK